MRQIFLLRHAHALQMPGEGDFDRPLSPQGREQAGAIAALMTHQSWEPDMVLCSSARRTRQTCAPVIERRDNIPVNFDEKLYLASAGQLFRALQESDDARQSILLVGHNPGIYDLAQFLLGSGPDQLTNKLMMQYRPATLAVFNCSCKAWADLMPAQNPLIALHTIES